MKSEDLLKKLGSHVDGMLTAFSYDIAQLEGELVRDKRRMLATNLEWEAPDNTGLDAALLAMAPVAVVPKFSKFEPLRENGHRFLLGAPGIYLEVRRPWLHFVRLIAEQDAKLGNVVLPFGTLEPKVELAFGRIGNALDHIQAFARRARKTDVETGALLAWDSQARLLKLVETKEEGTPASLTYRQAPLADHESLAIDLHSHGTLPAFFSDTDNQDDAGSVKLAGVLGTLGTDQQPTAAFRLCVLGLYLPIPVPPDAIFAQLRAEAS